MLYSVVLILLALLWISIRQGQRTALDVLHDMREEEGEANSTARSDCSAIICTTGSRCSSKFGQLYSDVSHTIWWCISCGLVAGISVTTVAGSLLAGLAVAGSIIGLLYLINMSRRRRAERIAAERLLHMLPLVMERLVMAVQSGLDVTAGIQCLLSIAENEQEGGQVEPVTDLLRRVMQLSEKGLGFSQALREVADTVPSTAVKHAFIHLAVAHDEGGELIRPLRELSDSTQLFYQESVEEYIAQVPVQATFPLICTFAGLILFFVTPPLVQVMDVLATVELPE